MEHILHLFRNDHLCRIRRKNQDSFLVFSFNNLTGDAFLLHGKHEVIQPTINSTDIKRKDLTGEHITLKNNLVVLHDSVSERQSVNQFACMVSCLTLHRHHIPIKHHDPIISFDKLTLAFSQILRKTSKVRIIHHGLPMGKRMCLTCLVSNLDLYRILMPVSVGRDILE